MLSYTVTELSSIIGSICSIGFLSNDAPLSFAPEGWDGGKMGGSSREGALDGWREEGMEGGM